MNGFSLQEEGKRKEKRGENTRTLLGPIKYVDELRSSNLATAMELGKTMNNWVRKQETKSKFERVFFNIKFRIRQNQLYAFPTSPNAQFNLQEKNNKNVFLHFLCALLLITEKVKLQLGEEKERKELDRTSIIYVVPASARGRVGEKQYHPKGTTRKRDLPALSSRSRLSIWHMLNAETLMSSDYDKVHNQTDILYMHARERVRTLEGFCLWVGLGNVHVVSAHNSFCSLNTFTQTKRKNLKTQLQCSFYFQEIEITYPGSFQENFFYQKCRNCEANALEMEYGTDVQRNTAQ